MICQICFKDTEKEEHADWCPNKIKNPFEDIFRDIFREKPSENDD